MSMFREADGWSTPSKSCLANGHFFVGFGFDRYCNKDALDVLVVGYDSAFGSGDGYVHAHGTDRGRRPVGSRSCRRAQERGACAVSRVDPGSLETYSLSHSEIIGCVPRGRTYLLKIGVFCIVSPRLSDSFGLKVSDPDGLWYQQRLSRKLFAGPARPFRLSHHD